MTESDMQHELERRQEEINRYLEKQQNETDRIYQELIFEIKELQNQLVRSNQMRDYYRDFLNDSLDTIIKLNDKLKREHEVLDSITEILKQRENKLH